MSSLIMNKKELSELCTTVITASKIKGDVWFKVSEFNEPASKLFSMPRSEYMKIEMPAIEHVAKVFGLDLRMECEEVWHLDEIQIIEEAGKAFASLCFLMNREGLAGGINDFNMIIENRYLDVFFAQLKNNQLI